MTIYIILISLSLLSHIFLKNKKIYFICNYSMMAVVDGFRHSSIGSDTLSHIRLQQEAGVWTGIDFFLSQNEQTRLEWGNLFFMQISNLFDFSQAYFVIIACVTYLSLGWFVYKNTDEKYYWLATFYVYGFGFFMYSMNAMRQAAAIAIAVNSYTYVKEKRIKTCILMLIIPGVFFHYSVLILAPFIGIIYYLNNSDKNVNGKILWLIKFVIIFSVLSVLVYNILMNNLYLLFEYGKYFVSTDMYSLPTEGGWFNIVRGIVYLFLIVLSFFMMQWKMKNKEYGREYIACTLMLTIALMFTVGEQLLFHVLYRMIDVFSIFVCLMAPLSVEIFRPWWLKPFYIVCLILIGMVSLTYMLGNSINGVGTYMLCNF